MGVVFNVWDAANRVIVEDLDKIDDSVLEVVYRDADRVLYSIVKNEMDRDEQITNVISFLGKKGRGKTSAMTSFYSYLNKLVHENRWSRFCKEDDKKINIEFCKLETIDAAMLAKNEFIIDVILAKMWDEFDSIRSNPCYNSDISQYEYLSKLVQDDFVNVRKAYLNLKYKESNAHKDLEKERDMNMANGLHDLGISINLKKSMKRLVENYIKLLCFKSGKKYGAMGYLVIAIDDLDMAKSKAWAILEQIRQFLSMPEVIVFITADIERLRDVCETYIKNEKSMSRSISKYVNDYLDKVLPINKRIYLPEISSLQDKIPIAKKDEIVWESQFEKEVIHELIAKYCDIYFYDKRRKKHFLQNDSLRSLVNYFNSLEGVDKDEYLNWLKKDLQVRLIERVEDVDQKDFLRSLFEQDYGDISNIIINYLGQYLQLASKEVYSEYSMGQVLYACSLYEADNFKNADFVNCILMLYSIICVETIKDSEMRNRIIGDSILGDWEYMLFSRRVKMNTISGFSKRAELKLDISDDIRNEFENKQLKQAMEKILFENEDKIRAWLYALLYVNIELPVSKRFDVSVERIQISEEIMEDVANELHSEEAQIFSEEKILHDELSVKLNISAKSGVLAFLYHDLASYKKVLEVLLKDVVAALLNNIVNQYNVEYSEEERVIIEKLYIRLIDEMQLKKEAINNSLINSTEILYELGKSVEKETKINISESGQLIEKLSSFYKLIEKQLQNVDKYYTDELHIPTNFATYFHKRKQVKLLLEKGLMSDSVRKLFEEYFRMIYGVISLEKMPVPR